MKMNTPMKINEKRLDALVEFFLDEINCGSCPLYWGCPLAKVEYDSPKVKICAKKLKDWLKD